MLVTILAGNPEMWIVAALALATVWRGFAPLVLLKPALFPLALFGIRSMTALDRQSPKPEP